MLDLDQVKPGDWVVYTGEETLDFGPHVHANLRCKLHQGDVLQIGQVRGGNCELVDPRCRIADYIMLPTRIADLEFFKAGDV